MAPYLKKWLINPIFRGSSNRQQEKRGQGPIENVDGVPKHEVAAEYAKKDEEDAVEDFNAPIRWWLLSTLFPLIAGTFGPMANAFNICAIVIDWRIYVTPTSTESEGSHIGDPTWLVGVNAVSLVIALIANFSLLLHMSGKLRFSLAAPCTILGWYVSGFVDIALVIAARTYLPLPDGEPATYSQAYYYGCFAGGIYVFLSIMLTFTAYGVFIGHYTDEFKLTLSQRSLMLQTMLYLGYLLAAGGIYSYIEEWDYLDAVYYVNVTLFTIGFGDFSPKTHLGRSLYFPMAIGGILFVGLIIANIRTLVLESAGRKISTRMVEKARFKALKTGNPGEGIFKLRGFHCRHIDGATELERREQEFSIMRDIQAQAAYDNRLISLSISGTCFFLLWLVGAAVFWQAEMSLGGENWTYFESLYFTYTSLLTIGYGDYYPQTNSGKPAFVFWSLLALPALTVLIGSVGDAFSDFAASITTWSGPPVTRFTNWLQRKEPQKSKGVEANNEIGEDNRRQESHDTTLAGIHRDEALHALANAEVFKAADNLIGDDRVINAQTDEDSKAAAYFYRPYIIMQEMKKILAHLDETPSRKYSFAEWTWLLKLIGEDESTSDGHRRPGHPADHDLEISAPMRDEKHHAWSWMGQESPLMSSEDEPRWILKRLMVALQKELKDRGDLRMIEHLEKRGKVGTEYEVKGLLGS